MSKTTSLNRQNALQRWMAAASPADKKALAEAAQTTVHALYTAARAVRNKGVLHLEPEFASRLEKAAVVVRKTSLKLPDLRLEQMAPVCASCQYLKACRK